MSAVLLLLWMTAVDGGTAPPHPRTPLSAEDAEILQNLELLEHMDEARDLDMLQELSVEH